MTAGATSCSCTVCGTVCTGRFAGCAAVWARGPREVAVDAPHVGKVNGEGNGTGDRWRLPLDPMRKAPAAPAKPTVVAAERAVPQPEPVAVIEPEVVAEREHEDVPAHVPDEPLEFQSPDVTTRYAVAQLTELNERLATLTELSTDRTEEALEKVAAELRRITSLREVDLTEQAAGIFGAVQAGADALGAFAAVVTELTTDLKTILSESLEAIGGTEGLAAWVAESATELTDIREEFATSLNRIERDLAVLRKRSQEPVEAMGMNLNDDQLTFIVEAVTEAVVSALQPQSPSQMRTMRGRR